ncbi:MAG TPA: aminopeptidase [Acholeplasmataceae bacterium]|nr:aminopeptidase [Acholeplasmataceae bacterium]
MDKRLQKYAELIVKVGVNVQEGQMVVINAPVECAKFARILVEEAYKAKASYVLVRWHDDLIRKSYFTYASLDVIKEVPEYVVKQFEEIVGKKAAVISISAPTPGLLKDIDPEKLQTESISTYEKIGFYHKFLMGNGSQWVVCSYPTEAWAKKVFPNDKNAFEKLLEAILKASRVDEDGDAIKSWQDHMNNLARVNKILNNYNFKSLHFKNSLGTDLEIGLVNNHVWAGGGEYTQDGIYFSPNIPTEETFTMPHKDKVNGKVVSTKPLNYQGKLIEDFYLVFKDGAVVDFDARTEKDTLENLLKLDEGSNRLGEVALISYDSPISNSNILFYNTLFDENASCHLALGNAYSMNIKDGTKMTEEELIELGYNKSMEHVDFMFGSRDLEIVGTTFDGKKVQIFKNGNFVF